MTFYTHMHTHTLTHFGIKKIAYHNMNDRLEIRKLKSEKPVGNLLKQFRWEVVRSQTWIPVVQGEE